MLTFAAVKRLGFILSLYLILLAVIPCCAFDNCVDDDNTSTAAHDDESKPCGNCSPFFSCGGCATATIAMEARIFELPLIKVPAVHSVYIPQQLPSMAYDFWQPPKIELFS